METKVIQFRDVHKLQTCHFLEHSESFEGAIQERKRGVYLIRDIRLD